MRKEVLLLLIGLSISGTVWGLQAVTRAWADGIYVTITAWNEHNNLIWQGMREQERRETRRKVNELEFIRDEERELTDREKLRLRDYRQDLMELEGR